MRQVGIDGFKMMLTAVAGYTEGRDAKERGRNICSQIVEKVLAWSSRHMISEQVIGRTLTGAAARTQQVADHFIVAFPLLNRLT